MDQRLAFNAAADTAVPASEAADVLVALRQNLVFHEHDGRSVSLNACAMEGFPEEETCGD